LDVSNNKLTFLPFELWKATQLKELNVAFNMLSELPVDDVMTRERSFSKTRLPKLH
jgi:Leucine-rich repeat (LRR) protein